MKSMFKQSLLILLVFTAIGASGESLPPNSDQRTAIFCRHSNDSAEFTVFLQTRSVKANGNALMVSNLRPYYQVPLLNKVQYVVKRDKSIQIDHATFSLSINPDGRGMYTRKGEPESPPDDLEVSSESSNSDSADANYNLYKPISLECFTPFTKIPPPTGFSVGN